MTQQPINPLPEEILDGIKFDDQPSDKKEQPSEVPADPVPTEKAADTPAPETPSETLPENNDSTKKSSLPARYDGESDIQYNLRVQLALAGQAKADATTEEEKTVLGEEMKRLRGQLSGKKPSTDPAPAPTKEQPKSDEKPLNVQEDEKRAALEALKALGVPTIEDLNKLVETKADEIVRQKLSQSTAETRVAEQTTAIEKFYSIRNDIYSDSAKRNTLENYVVNMFGDKLGTMSATEISAALDMSANYLFPKENNSKKLDSAQNKIDATNISGSSTVAPSAIDNNAKAALKAAGWSDQEIEAFGR